MKKKILLMLLLGGMTLMPTSMMAKSDYGWDDNAEILVNLNGEEVDYQVIDATTGMQIPISLPIYGSGEFTIQVKSGTTLLSIENI